MREKELRKPRERKATEINMFLSSRAYQRSLALCASQIEVTRERAVRNLQPLPPPPRYRIACAALLPLPCSSRARSRLIYRKLSYSAAILTLLYTTASRRDSGAIFTDGHA